MICGAAVSLNSDSRDCLLDGTWKCGQIGYTTHNKRRTSSGLDSLLLLEES